MTRLRQKNLISLGLFIFGLITSLGLATIINSGMVVAQAKPSQVNDLSQLNLVQAIVLGFVQGMTEFIPISSTAHLKAIPVFLGWGDPGVSFTAVIQLGSIVAVLWYFWSDLSKIAVGMVKAIRDSDYQSQDFWLALGITVGTIPIVIGGLLIKALIPDFDNSPLRSMTAIAIASIIMALLLALSEKVGTQRRNFEKLTARDGILMGCAQALALIPGVSRSGSTLTAGLLINLERATAARFSFLLGLPAITLAGLVELKDALDQGLADSGFVPLLAGVISSAVFSYLAIAWLIKFLQKRSTWVFVWYRLAFGVFILVAIAFGWLSNY
ncbi:Undecaprenyl-diphosphatase [Stanieria cyanosphaera PCC 7437]|uniref:Undecaprenyl-diphosphatase n=1 Tax=Stanieria cyanosphaera (strain ATCC 29371 / PCC 7437) TaxID=111780 RepID=K9XWY2_STAC7|nr:undecaprenyl-diphosphate phosphatase [Stanieria cyanosphaera]AFZ36591.1 Undecaprenyl-diphosphatase [Stanieria cyanosphaera PCC 7437]